MTPTATHRDASTLADTSLEWANQWTQPDHTHPITFGVDQAVNADGTKFYRAFAYAGGGLDKMLHSPVYEACDGADVARNESWIPTTSKKNSARQRNY